MSYEVQTLTLCDGWVNTWFVEYAAGCRYPETFATRAAAQAALDEFFTEIEEEIAVGQRAPDQGYDEDDYRIAQVGVS